MDAQSSGNDVVPYRWVILALATATFLITFFIRFAWPPLIPVVVPLLKMTMSQAGAYMSAFYAGYLVTQIPAGLLADRFGVRLIIALSLIIEGISTYFMGSIGNYETGFVLRLVTGLGAGAVFGACSRAIMEWFPARERGTAFGIMFAAPSGGIVLASLVVTPLNAAIGWQGAFRVSGIIAIVVGIIVYLATRTSDQVKSSEGIFAGFPVVFGSKDLLLTALAGFCLMWVELGTATWTVAAVKKMGLSLGVAGSVMLAYGVGGIIAPYLSGSISDRIGNRKWILIIAYIILIPVTLIFGHQTTAAWLIPMGFIFGFVSYLSNPHLTILISEFAGKKYAGLANGTSNVIFQFAPMIGPYVMGWSIDATGSFTSVWWMMAAGPLVGILLLLGVNPAKARG